MTQLQKAVIAGATGNLGPAIISALLAAGFTVTALTRDATKGSQFGDRVKVVEVDYDSHDSLVSAFRGADIVISTLGGSSMHLNPTLISAAITAKVPRFVPSDFGSDLSNPKAHALPVYASKVQTEELLHAKAKEGAISYTSIRCGPFLDWGIMVGFLIDAKGRSVELYDGGERRFSTTALESVGKALAAALSKPEESKNRVYYVQDAVVTQKQLLEYGQELTGQDWKVTHASVAELRQASGEALNRNDYSMPTMVGFLKSAVFGEGYGAEFGRVDNEELGLQGLKEEQIKEVLGRYL